MPRVEHPALLGVVKVERHGWARRHELDARELAQPAAVPALDRLSVGSFAVLAHPPRGKTCRDAGQVEKLVGAV
ncbi:MAG: hypothetical protein ACRDLY_13295 [Thermoleophilaceae bacterium]